MIQFTMIRLAMNIMLEFHVNHLPADDSHKKSSLVWLLDEASKFENVLCCKF